MFCWIDLLKYGKCNTDFYLEVAFVLKIEKKQAEEYTFCVKESMKEKDKHICSYF